jgi:sugar phosphate isomerase/epimerase
METPMLSRRSLISAALTTAPALAAGGAFARQVAGDGVYKTPPMKPGSNAVMSGVRIGAQTYCFHDVPRNGDPTILPMLIDHMHEVGLNDCEIMSAHVEQTTGLGNGWWVKSRTLPGYEEQRMAAREWRLTVPLSYYENVRAQLAAAGIGIFIYNLNFNDTFTDEERDRSFLAARALGAQGINASNTISEVRRLVPFAEKHRMFFAAHNHNNIYDPDQFATPQSFETAFALSPWIRASLDIGHYVAGDNDPYEFLQKHHDRIVSLHIRDRKKSNGPHVPLGQGDARVADILRFVRDQRLPIRCYIELEYGSLIPPVEEVKRALTYCRKVLSA